MSETIKETAVTQATMLEVLDELTDTDRKAVARAVAIIKSIQPTPEAQARLVVAGVEKLLEERESKSRAFTRRLFTAIMSGIKQGMSEVQKLFEQS